MVFASSEITLSTQRLILRPIRMNDAEEIFHYRSDSITNKYQGWIPKKIKDVQDFINERVSPAIDINGTWFQFVMTLKPGGEIIGDIGLHFFDTENKQVEIGCTLNKDYQKNGYASEAMQEVINFVFISLNKHRIIASVAPENLSSIRMVRKLNFRKEAHFRQSILSNGTWIDDIIYAILRSEWSEK